MVTFRFYLVSLVAVFLALAMGVVVGSTLIDRAIVDRLDRSVESVGDRLRPQQDENAELGEEAPGRLRDRAWGRLVTALGGGSVQGDPLQELVESGFVTYQDVGEVESGVDALAGVGEQIVLVAGPGSQLGPDLTLA